MTNFLAFLVSSEPTTQFTGVFVLRGRLFLTLEEKVGGPRAIRGLPQELPHEISAESLGAKVLAALAAFRDTGRSVSPEEWEKKNQELLAAFQVSSVSAFERQKREVTVRRDRASGEIYLFGPSGESRLLPVPTPRDLGLEVRSLLGLR